MIERYTRNVMPQVASKVADKISPAKIGNTLLAQDDAKKLSTTLDCLASVGKPMVGKHKIPRFLYHFTSEINYQSMLNDGYMRPSYADGMLDKDAVFMVDLVNFLKDWKRRPEWSNEDLSWQLLAQTYTHGSKNMVLLRIPTRKLEVPEDLVIRSQRKFFKCDNNLFEDAAEMDRYFDGLHFEDDMDYFNASRLTLEKFHPEIAQHLRFGDKAANAPLYKQRREAIEFAYMGKIPIENVELVGKASFPNEDCIDVFEAMTQLLRGKPEEKMLAFLY